MTDEIKNASAPAKVRKVRSAKPAKVETPRLPLVLAKPTTSNGAANATLMGTVEKKFARIAIQDGKSGADIVIIHSTHEADKSLSPGSATILFVYTLIDAVLAGQGAGPDGSAMYASENWDKFVAYWGQHVKTHNLVCEPAGRAGAQGYIGTLEEFFQQAALKAKLVQKSIKRFGVSRPHQRTRAEKQEVIEVRL